MLEMLQFVFSGFWTWAGTAFLLLIIVTGCTVFTPLDGCVKIIYQRNSSNKKGE